MSGEQNNMEGSPHQRPMCGPSREGMAAEKEVDVSEFDSACSLVRFVAVALVLGMVPDLLWYGTGLLWAIQNVNEWLTFTVSAQQVMALIRGLLRLTCMGVAVWELWKYADVLRPPYELVDDAVPFATAHWRLARMAAGCLGLGCLLDACMWLT